MIRALHSRAHICETTSTIIGVLYLVVDRELQTNYNKFNY